MKKNHPPPSLDQQKTPPLDFIRVLPFLSSSRVQGTIPQNTSLSETAEKIHATVVKSSSQKSADDSLYSLDEATIIETLTREIPDLDTSSLDDKQLLVLGLMLHVLHTKSQKYATSPEDLSKHYARDRECIKDTKLDHISISLSKEEMMSTFNQHGVIQLRPLTGESLLIGCGHSHMHHHSETVDTLDATMDYNPTVCTEWGSRQCADFFRDKSQYNQVLDEGPILALSIRGLDTPTEKAAAVNDFFNCVRSALKPGGLLALPTFNFTHGNSILTFDIIPPDFRREEIPPDHQSESSRDSFWFRYTP